MQVDPNTPAKNELACRMFAVEKALHIAQIAGNGTQVSTILEDAERIFQFVQTEPAKKSSLVAVHGNVGR